MARPAPAADRAIDAWPARLGDAPDDAGETHLRSLATVRARGCAVSLEVATCGELGRALVESTDDPHADRSHERIAALVAQQIDRIGTLVRRAAGRVTDATFGRLPA